MRVFSMLCCEPPVLYFTCLLLAAPFLLNTHFIHLVYSSFVACFCLSLMHASPKYTPQPLHFCLSFACYSVALCLTVPLFTWLLYVNILWHKTTFASQLRQPHLWHSALWLFLFLCHSSHAYFMRTLYGMGHLCAPA